MRCLTAQNYENLLTGSAFFGTGGGGNPALGQKIYRKIIRRGQKVSLKKLEQFRPEDVFITAFAVGGLKQKNLPTTQIKKGLILLQKQIAKPIKGIIPVEIGPLATAIAANLAAELNLPLIDADFVGGRSTPEVFLETISLFNIKRTPLIVVNSKNDIANLANSTNYQFEEDFLRTFSAISKETVYVLGYPITQKVAKKCLCQKTVSLAIKTGEKINRGKLVGKLLFQGKITTIKDIKQNGFTSKIVEIKNNQELGKLYLKNENLIFWINDRPILTCPDLIILIDLKNQPIYNLDLRRSMSVKVVGLPAQPLWRTKNSLKLFNPKLFGYNIEQRLL